MQVGLELEGFDALKSAMDNHCRRVARSLDKTLDKEAKDLVANSQQNLRKNGSNAMGGLSASGHSEKQGELDYKVGFYSDPKGDHAEFVEYGRKAGKMPPPTADELVEWVRVKLRVRDRKEAKQVAWRVARKIARAGTKARPFFGPEVEATKERVNKAIQKAIAQLTK